MKQLLPAILMLLMFSGCTKIYSQELNPPVEIKVDTVAENENEDIFWCVLTIPAKFPGGTNAWHRFLKKNLVYSAIAIKQNIQGTVIVKFMVCADGTLCDIEAISGPNELKESAVQVFKKSRKWKPASRNGRNCKDYKTQPIIFRLK